MFLSKPHTYTLMLSISPTLSLTQSHPSVVRMRGNRNHRLSEKQTYPRKYKSDPNTFPSLSPKSPEAALPRGTTHVLQHLETPHWMIQTEHFLIAQSSEICPAPFPASPRLLPAPGSSPRLLPHQALGTVPVSTHLSVNVGLCPTHLCGHSSAQFSHSVMSDSLRPHGLQHVRPPCPSPTPGVYSNSCPWSQ